MFVFLNRVTEKDILPKRFWVVSCEWRGGHNRRRFTLENIHLSEKAAITDWERLTPENHNRQHNLPAEFDAGFVRHPLRFFEATEVPMK